MRVMDQFDDVMKGITPFAMPQDGKFDYPTDKKRTKEATETMIKAEQNLDLFWRKFDANWKRLTRQTNLATMVPNAPDHLGLELERTAAWVDLIEASPSVPTTRTPEPKEWADTSIGKEKISTASKSKIKTKGTG